jgi:2-polyprenyl-3-methyl-5-hydroxy-6-metoxy-1,4-benzoquinol methylase
VRSFDGREYQARIDALRDGGLDIHGEAALIRGFSPTTVLDAGCGTGRVAIELARHGVETIGVDIDASMISEARRQAPELVWILSDLATLALGRSFDVVVLAGNVPLFCSPEARASLVRSCAEHVRRGGTMIAGFGLGQSYELRDYDAACEDAGLTLAERFATWDGEPFAENSPYAVSIHGRPEVEEG